MAITYPTTLDTLTNPAATDSVATVSHSSQHSNVNDAVEALEAKVGVDSSAVTTSLDYKVKNAASVDPGHLHSEAGLSLADNTTLNSSTTKHGFLKKLSNTATEFMDGTGAWDTIKDSDVAFTDITTNDVSSTKHGFAPKGDGTTTKFLNANGAYSTPGGGTTFVTTQVFAGTAPNATFTDLDLSSVVGASSRMVMLKLKYTTTNGTATVTTRRNGDTSTFITTAGAGPGSATLGGTTDNCAYIITVTDSAGVIEWTSSGASQSITITVESYW